MEKFKARLIKVAAMSLVLVCFIALGGCSYKQAVDYILPSPKEAAKNVSDSTKNIDVLPDNTPISEAATKQAKYTLVLYFGDKAGDKVVAEKRQVSKVRGMARKAINELLKGPRDAKHVNAIPKGTKLLDINLKPDGLCIVSFSKEIVKNHPGGTSGESLTVASIVNTLTQFPTISKVQILVEGKKVETLAGHLDVSQPIDREAEMIKTN